MSGCGVSHKSSKSVVESLIKYYVEGKETEIKDCYNQKQDTEESLQTEIDATISYFSAHNASKLDIIDCDIISEYADYTYVYIRYNLVLDKSQEYPCIGTYIVGKNNNKYYVLPPSEITSDMSTKAATDYAKFMTTDTYKQYTREYDAFIKKNPGYEEQIAGEI
jgi:hypothetical protein